MSWIRGTASNHLDFSTKLKQAATGRSVQSASVNSGGAGYVVGDILTVAGGTGTVAAQIEVVSVSGGVITAVRVYNGGVYTVDPSTPNGATGGSGTGASIGLTFAANGWTALFDQTYSGSEREVMLVGSGGGADSIYVGWRTLSNVGADYYNLELHGMTGYSAGLSVPEQPGVSPGFYDNADTAARWGAYLITATVSFEYFLNITPYRIIITAHVGSAYMHGYLGWGNRLALSTEYPNPLVVAGSDADYDNNQTYSQPISTITDPWSGQNAQRGPMLVAGFDGTWHSILNRSVTNPSGAKCVVPTQRPSGFNTAPSLPEDRFCSTSTPLFGDIIYSLGTGAGGATNANLLPTGTDRIMLPCYVVLSDPSPQILLEIADVFWVSAFGGVTSEDRIMVGSVPYRVFKNCNRTDSYAFLAIKEG